MGTKPGTDVDARSAVNASVSEASKPDVPDDPRELDRLLIEASAKGDAQAFRRLVAKYQRRAYGVAYGIVHNTDDAREVVQDAFMRVYRHLDDFEGSASFGTWLYRIVHNLSIDHLRRRRRPNGARTVEIDDHTNLEGGTAELLPWRGSSDPFESLDRARLVAAMQEALAQLPEYHRTIIVLREVDGLSYEEIAEIMQVPKGTVMSRLFHARRKMQRILRERLGDEVPLTADERDALDRDSPREE